MKEFIAKYLICPACLPRESALPIDVRSARQGDILEGALLCPQCGMGYPITDGIAFLAPRTPSRNAAALSKYERTEVISSYIWSHFGDLMHEEEASAAYSRWAELVTPCRGPALDAGCAVGRLTFEMARKLDCAIGVDISPGFIRIAREILHNRRLHLTLSEEGKIRREALLVLPSEWETERVEFIVADVQALPFSSGLFSCVASLNIVDKVPSPLAHLNEVNRVARNSAAQLLFSDPFSWSVEVAPEENWLGGVMEGEYAGRGFDNVISLLEGGKPLLSPPWTVENSGSPWWKIRNHGNHFELIRSHFIKAWR